MDRQHRADDGEGHPTGIVGRRVEALFGACRNDLEVVGAGADRDDRRLVA